MSCCNECEESNGCNDCGGNCGTAKEYITKQGIQGEDGYGYNAASTTSSDILDTVATSGAFTITTKKAYTPGARVRFSDSANPSTNYFEGIVTAYNALTGAMTVSSVDLKVGTGTIASWNVNLAGELPFSTDYTFQISQSIDFLDSFTFPEVSVAASALLLGTISINASAAGKNKLWKVNSPVKLMPMAQLTNLGSPIAPVAKIEGVVATYNVSTGAMTVNVQSVQGIGTYSDWLVDLTYPEATVRYLNGLTEAPSGASSQHGTIEIPENTVYRAGQCIKMHLVGKTAVSVNPGVVEFDGVTVFSKIFTEAVFFNLDITINIGYNVTVICDLRTETGTDNHIQTIGTLAVDPTYATSIFKPKFKTQLDVTLPVYVSQPWQFYSGTAYRL